MGFIELFLTGVGLSMDAFAVAICKGLGMRKIRWRDALVSPCSSGAFRRSCRLSVGPQARCSPAPSPPSITGLLSGFSPSSAARCSGTPSTRRTPRACAGAIARRANAAGGADCDDPEAARQAPIAPPLDYRELVMLAIATSIDALAVGITFAFLGVNIWVAITIIGVTTFVLSLVGVVVGNQFGSRSRTRTIAGGIALILTA